MQTVPLAKLGPVQILDLERSRGGIAYYNEYARICTIVKQDPERPGQTVNHIGDQSPYRMARRFKGHWQDYNHQFVVQTAGCVFQCPFCYVDNLKEDCTANAPELVNMFKHFRKEVKQLFNADVNVFHLMGGNPAKYAAFWPTLRQELDKQGCADVVLFSDCLLVEDAVYDIKPWEYVDLDRFMLACCLKGTNGTNFRQNTGCDLFVLALYEATNYIQKDNCYITLINYDPADLKSIYNVLPKIKVDLLQVFPYEVTVQRQRGLL